MSFIQELNSKINEHQKSFSTEMKELFIKNDIKGRTIRDFNKADLDIKLIDDGPFEEKLSLNNYISGDYVNFAFYNMSARITLSPVHNLETNEVSDYVYTISHGCTSGEHKPYKDNDYKQYIINDAKNYEYGLLTVKDSVEYKKLIDTFYNSLQTVLGGHDGVL